MLDDYHTAAVRLAEIFVKAYDFGTHGIFVKANHGKNAGMIEIDARQS